MLIIKNNKLIVNGNKLGISVSKKEESNIPEGFVDLGLSVLWVTCNLGASKPEGEGLYYKWGSKDGYTIDLVQNFNDDEVRTYDYDAVYYNCNFSENDKELLNPRVFSKSDFSELCANTTRQYEVINGIQGVRYISNLNGNSIFLPLYNAVGNFDGYYPLNGYWTSSNQFSGNLSIGNAIYFSDKVNTFVTSGDSVSSIANNSNTGLLIRAVCNIPPKYTLLEYGKEYAVKNNKIYQIKNKTTNEQSDPIQIYSNYPASIYLSNVPEIDVNSAIKWEFSFDSNLNKYFLLLSNSDIKKFCLYTDEYIYILTDNKKECIFKIDKWDAPNNLNKTKKINFGEEIEYYSQYGTQNLRIYYNDWYNLDINLDWCSGSLLKFLVSDIYGDSISSSGTNTVYYKTVSKNSNYTISKDVINTWADRVDENGYLHVRINTTASYGSLIITKL